MKIGKVGSIVLLTLGLAGCAAPGPQPGAIEIRRGLSWSLEISDLLTPRLEEIRHLQRAIAALQAPPATRRDSTVSEGQEPLAAA